MKRNKSGISLIVLVITIIVMIILAAAIIISISNSGIVNRANEAVEKSDEAQMKQLATIAWSEVHLKDTTETKDDAYYLREVKAYLTASGISEAEQNKYIITATTQGVSVKRKDMTAPTGSIANGNITAFSITVDVTATDSESGIKEYRYYIKQDSETDYVLKETLTTASYTFEELDFNTTYDVKVEVEDNSENVTTLHSENVTTKEVEITTLGALVASAENYGDETNYSANGIESWKVFYKQTVSGVDYVYLITSNIAPKDTLPTNLPNMSFNDYGHLNLEASNNNAVVITTTGTIKNKLLWMANWSNYNSEQNARIASYLLAESYWEAFKNTEKYGDNVVDAIGTPSLEMFAASWNQKGAIYNTNETTKYVKIEYSEKSSGYELVGSESGTLTVSGSNDKLYFPTSQDKYHLAAPHHYGNADSAGKFVITVQPIADSWSPRDAISGWNPYLSLYGIRPVVCLKASTPAYAGPNGRIMLVEQ